MFQRFFRRGPRVSEDEQEKIEQGVRKTRASFFGRIAVLLGRTQITDDLWDELEELLIGADVGAETTDELLERLRARYRAGEFRSADELSQGLQDELIAL